MMSSEIFTVLADPTRRALLVALSAGESPVGDLVERVGASQPTVSKHLRILREADLVQQRADGQRRLYRLHSAGLTPAREWLEQFNLEPQSADVGTEIPVQPVDAQALDTVRPDSIPSAGAVLDPLVVAQTDEQPRGRGLLAQVLRRRRGRAG